MSQVHDNKVKEKVLKARKSGKTYRELTSTFGIPKSTLSYWFGESLGHPYDQSKQLAHLERIRPLAHLAIQKRIEHKAKTLTEKIKSELKDYPTENRGLKKLFLSALYWAEGAKHAGVNGLRFVNTDPKLSHLYITLLRQCYVIDEAKLRVRLHLHYYHGIKDTRRTWSELLKIPESQFGKIYIKKRSSSKKFRKNFGGICFIIYGNSEIRMELMELAKQYHSLVVE
jgi:hypothetical protein